MAKLVTTVFLTDPDKHRTVVQTAGEEPERRLAALITNPACWEDGNLPDSNAGDSAADDDQSEDDKPSGDASEDAKPAAKKAATRPARGRKAAAEGGGSQ
jgi:hypothetical protein